MLLSKQNSFSSDKMEKPGEQTHLDWNIFQTMLQRHNLQQLNAAKTAMATAMSEWGP